MAKMHGRNLIIQKNNVTIASARVTGYKWAGEPIDTTDKDLLGVREMLSEMAGESVELTLEGLSNSATLRDIAMTRATSKMLTDITLEYAGGTTAISGNFMLVAYEETGDYKDAVTFSATLQSSGNWTYTA